MNRPILHLTHVIDRKEIAALELFSIQDNAGQDDQDMPQSLDNTQCVYAPLEYAGALTSLDNGLTPTALYVNTPEFAYPIYLGGPVKDGACKFKFTDKDRDRGKSKILHGRYGYARFIAELKKEDGEVLNLQTKWVPIYVKPDDPDNSRMCRSMGDMAYFIFCNCTPFWGEVHLQEQEKLQSIVSGGQIPSSQQSLAAKLQLLENIVHTYEQVMPFFHTASKHRVRPEKQWVSFQEASHLTNDTIQGILRHPHYLDPAGEQGIQVQGRSFLPRKVIAAAGREDYNIYENQYVVGFLRRLQDDIIEMRQSTLAQLREQARQRRSKIGKKKPPPECVDGYVDSSYWTQELMVDRLESQLNTAQVRIARLHAAYRNILPAVPDTVKASTGPRPTAIFRTVHHYRSIYELACQWFQFGVHDFKQEAMLLPFLGDYDLYEYYVLIKLLCHLTQNKFELTGRKTVSGHRRRPDLFLFRRGDLTVTVFYEPQIFGSGSAKNLKTDGLELFCNTSYSEKGKQTFNHSFHPDYVIKFKRENHPAGYMILDAKLSDYKTTQQLSMPQLVYKYLFGLSPIHPEHRDRILGLCLIYGRPKSEKDEPKGFEGITNICDQIGSGPFYGPFARLIELRTGSEDRHAGVLEKSVSLKAYEEYEAFLENMAAAPQQ